MMKVKLNIVNSGLYCGECGIPMKSTIEIPKFCPKCGTKLWSLE